MHWIAPESGPHDEFVSTRGIGGRTYLAPAGGRGRPRNRSVSSRRCQ